MHGRWDMGSLEVVSVVMATYWASPCQLSFECVLWMLVSSWPMWGVMLTQTIMWLSLSQHLMAIGHMALVVASE